MRWDDRLARAHRLPPAAADLTAWRDAVDPDHAGLFDKRLAWEGLSPDQAGAALLLRDEPVAVDLPRAFAPLPETRIPFADLWWPIAVAALPASDLLTATACERMRLHLTAQLSRLTARALMEQFNADVAVGAQLLAKLGVGPAGRERYEAFVARGPQPLFDEFPVLRRLVAVTVDNWREAVAKLLARIAADAPLLAERFGANVPVTDVMLGAGDTHRGGRSTAILDLDGVRVVYKPRDLRLEREYATIAAEFTGSAQPDVLAVGHTHGYVSFIEPSVAQDLAGFYRGAGRLLALLYFLGASDCHHENLIAAGQDYVLIDTETLFEGQLANSRPLDDSVLRVGMLPTWMRVGGGVADVSALGVEELLPWHGNGWLNINTDAMAWGPVETEPVAISSLPVAAGVANPVGDHVEDLVAGFTEGYRVVLDAQGRENLCIAVQRCAGLRRRIVLRATHVYMTLLARAASPDCLRDSVVRGLELDRLSRAALLADEPGPQWEVFGAELFELENLDVPYFEFELGDDEVIAADRRISGLLTGDGLADSLARIRGASEADLSLQVDLIRAAVGARSHKESVPLASLAPGAGDDLAAAALDAIRRSMITVDGRATWLSLNPAGADGRVTLALAGDDAYYGAAGLAVFLDAAGETELLAQAWDPVVRQLAEMPDAMLYRRFRDGGLGMSGAGGLLRVLDRLGDPEGLRERIVAAVAEGLPEKDAALDQMAGGAGAVLPLLDLGEQELVYRIADHLERAQNGGWRVPAFKRSLTGFSHGASGIGLAMLRAGVALGENRFVDAGARAFGFERELFDAGAGNWPDLREDPPAFMVAWCHGAPGIGLARFEALRLLPDHPDSPMWRDELAAAVHTTAAVPLGPADHVCCGNLSRALVLARVGEQQAADRIFADVEARWRETGQLRFNNLQTGSSAGIVSLMAGVSGIGMYALGGDAARWLGGLLV